MEKMVYKSVDTYISSFNEDGQKILKAVRAAIKEVAPEAQETMAYGMPAYKLDRPLAYFALYENHLGFYPTPEGIENFAEALKPYKQGRGSVQFPLDRPLPLDLIKQIVLSRLASARNLHKKSRIDKV